MAISSKHLLEKFEHKLKEDWKNKAALEGIKQGALKIKGDLKGFNKTAGLFGLAVIHTSAIYSRKLVLHEFERKAIPHLAMCVGVGLAFGLVIGQIYGSNYHYYTRTSNLLKAVDNRLNDI